MADIDMVSRGGSLAKKKTTMEVAHNVTETVAGGFSVFSQLVGASVIVICFVFGAAYWLGSLSQNRAGIVNPVQPTSIQMPWR